MATSVAAKKAVPAKKIAGKKSVAEKQAAPAKRPNGKRASPPKKAIVHKAKRQPPPQRLPPHAPDLYSSIHALLHTMRVIEQHEEPLCSMQDELKRTGKLSAPHRRRLQQLVQELPADVYQHDLETLRQAVAA